MAARLAQLVDVRKAIWTHLRDAVVAANRHEWRTCVVATLAADNVPDARYVVLRDVDEARGHLVFYTDARSPKVEQLAAAPNATIVFHSRALAWQLRVRSSLSGSHERT